MARAYSAALKREALPEVALGYRIQIPVLTLSLAKATHNDYDIEELNS